MTQPPKYRDYGLNECARALKKLQAERPNATFFQKWTCGGCGKRIVGNTPNKLFERGHCEECGHITDIRKTGCNYAIHMVIGGLADAAPKGSA